MIIDDSISTIKLWEVLKMKIIQPQLFLPVTDVIIRKSDNGLGIFREMTSGVNRIIENIYEDENTFELFVLINSDDKVVNRIVINDNKSRYLEFFLRNKESLEKGPWTIVPKHVIEHGMLKVLEKAKE